MWWSGVVMVQKHNTCVASFFLEEGIFSGLYFILSIRKWGGWFVGVYWFGEFFIYWVCWIFLWWFFVSFVCGRIQEVAVLRYLVVLVVITLIVLCDFFFNNILFCFFKNIDWMTLYISYIPSTNVKWTEYIGL